MKRNVRGKTETWVGWVDDPADIVERAVVNEFGSVGRHVPERPALRNTIRNNLPKYASMLKDGARAIYALESTPESVLDKLGKVAAADLQAEIASLSTPPNAPETVRTKGRNDPLVETGRMRGAVDHEVKA
ncbi:MAG: hypothetical protein J0H34_22505 [Rhizobiales bacterium]|nr:hypothetical protein [Hyphomicrobiales bacterium]